MAIALAGGTYEEWRAWGNALPISLAMNLHCIELRDSGGSFEVQESSLPLNPNGAVNGGVVAALVDHAMGQVAAACAPPGKMPATADLNIQYMRPAMAPLRIEVELNGGGRRLAFIEAVVRDRDGKQCNLATGTFVVGGSPDVMSAPGNNVSDR